MQAPYQSSGAAPGAAKARSTRSCQSGQMPVTTHCTNGSDGTATSSARQWRNASSNTDPRLTRADQHHRRYFAGTVTLIEICSGAVDCGAMAMDQRWGVGISGGSVERGNLTPDREALIYFGSPLGRAEPMPSWSKMRGDGAKGRQEPLGMPHRFKAFHRPFALSGGLMRVLGAIVEIPRLPVRPPTARAGGAQPASWRACR